MPVVAQPGMRVDRDAAAGRTSRWRCGPVTLPVAPTRPMVSPVVTLPEVAPSTTGGSTRSRCRPRA